MTDPRFLIYGAGLLGVAGLAGLLYLMRGGVKGWHVLAMILGFFAVTIGVNMLFVTRAVGTHPGEDIPRSYVQGLNYNETLERRARQAELGWSARFNAAEGRVVIAVEDSVGEPVRGLELTGALRHHTLTERDCLLEFSEAEAGVYRAPIECAGPGDWTLEASHEGEPPFELTGGVRL